MESRLLVIGVWRCKVLHRHVYRRACVWTEVSVGVIREKQHLYLLQVRPPEVFLCVVSTAEAEPVQPISLRERLRGLATCTTLALLTPKQELVS